MNQCTQAGGESRQQAKRGPKPREGVARYSNGKPMRASRRGLLTIARAALKETWAKLKEARADVKRHKEELATLAMELADNRRQIRAIKEIVAKCRQEAAYIDARPGIVEDAIFECIASDDFVASYARWWANRPSARLREAAAAKKGLPH